MVKREPALLDRQVVERATSRFALKRETLPPEAVEAVASDTVRRLAQLPQVARSFEVPDIDEAQSKPFTTSS